MSKPDFAKLAKMGVISNPLPNGAAPIAVPGASAPGKEGTGREKSAQAQQLEELLQEQSGSQIPPEVYELMAVVINFARDLGEQWVEFLGDSESP